MGPLFHPTADQRGPSPDILIGTCGALKLDVAAGFVVCVCVCVCVELNGFPLLVEEVSFFFWLLNNNIQSKYLMHQVRRNRCANFFSNKEIEFVDVEFLVAMCVKNNLCH